MFQIKLDFISICGICYPMCRLQNLSTNVPVVSFVSMSTLTDVEHDVVAVAVRRTVVVLLLPTALVINSAGCQQHHLL